MNKDKIKKRLEKDLKEFLGKRYLDLEMLKFPKNISIKINDDNVDQSNEMYSLIEGDGWQCRMKKNESSYKKCLEEFKKKLNKGDEKVAITTWAGDNLYLNSLTLIVKFNYLKKHE